jgi:sporulation and spore germination protein/immunoglobulin-like protein involved in spore germination
MKRALLPLLTVVVLAACGSATGDLGSVAPPAPTSQSSLEPPSPESTPGATQSPGTSPGPTDGPDKTPKPDPTEPSGFTTVRSFFFLGSFTDNAGLVPVLREVPQTQAVGTAALTALLAGPNEAELSASPAMYTAIPEGTRLLGLRIEGGIATVNLSREFESGGGSASVLGRLAQVVFALTQFPSIQGVRFELDGVPVEVFSGEGVVLTEPVGRDDYYDQLPAIFVNRPAWGGVLANPATIGGLANTFEAALQVRILDGEGRTLAQGPAMATCGTGCWGTFEVSVPYTVARAGWGRLQVFEFSAADGSEVNLTEYPVWLTP